MMKCLFINKSVGLVLGLMDGRSVCLSDLLKSPIISVCVFSNVH